MAFGFAERYYTSSPFPKSPPFTTDANAMKVFRELCFLLWMDSDGDSDGADPLFAVVYNSFHDEPMSLATFVNDDIVAVYGSVPILERVCQSLNTPGETLGGGLHCSIFLGSAHILMCPVFWPHLSQNKVFSVLQNAMDYHLQQFPHDEMELNMLFSWIKFQ